MPLRILATLASGWKASPSANSHPSTVDSPLATVDFPQPETPMTITTSGSSTSGRASLSAMSAQRSAVRSAVVRCAQAQFGREPGQAPVSPGRAGPRLSSSGMPSPPPGRVGVPDEHGELVDDDGRPEVGHRRRRDRADAGGEVGEEVAEQRHPRPRHGRAAARPSDGGSGRARRAPPAATTSTGRRAASAVRPGGADDTAGAGEPAPAVSCVESSVTRAVARRGGGTRCRARRASR